MATYFSKGFGGFPVVQNPYPVYTDAEAIAEGQKIGNIEGTQIGKNIQAQRRLELDMAREARLVQQQDEVREAQFQETINSWRIPEKSEFNNVQIAAGNYAAMAIKAANKLRDELDAGNILPKDFAAGMGSLEGSLAQFKTAQETWNQRGNKYLAGIEDNSISNANKPEDMQVYSQMFSNKGTLEYKNTKDGQIKITGTYTDLDGNPAEISLPMSEIDRMPEILYKPTVKIQDHKVSDINSIIEAKLNDSLSKTSEDGPRGIAELSYQVQNSKKEGQDTIRTLAENSFQQYVDQLGEGDETKKYIQYALDTDLKTKNNVEAAINDLNNDAISDNLKNALNKGGTYEDIEAILNSRETVIIKGEDGDEAVNIGTFFKDKLKQKYINDFYLTYNNELARKKGDLSKIEFTDRSDQLKFLQQEEKIAKSKANIDKINTPSSGKDKKPKITVFDKSLDEFTDYFVQANLAPLPGIGTSPNLNELTFNEKTNTQKIQEIAKKLKNTKGLGNLQLGLDQDNYISEDGSDRKEFSSIAEAAKEGYLPRFELKGQSFKTVDDITPEDILDPLKLEEYIRNGSTLDKVNNNPQIN